MTYNLFLAVWLIAASSACAFGSGTIQMDTGERTVTLADGKTDLVLRLNYNNRCTVDQVIVRGHDVAAAAGVCSGVRENGRWFTTRDIATPAVSVNRSTLTLDGTAWHHDTLTIDNIVYGPAGHEIHESWKFTVGEDQIIWRIKRKYPSNTLLEDSAFPEWDFSSLSTWTGGLLDNGGVVLDKYLDKANTTYGGHFGTVTFWNFKSGDCLRITPDLPHGYYGAGRFSHQPDGDLSFDYVVNDQKMIPKHALKRFLTDRQDLWLPFHVKHSEVTEQLTLQALDYGSICGRGTMPELNAASIGELLNTVARYGVIDQQLVGGNGWRSGYICLHEPFFAEMALALDETDYTANLSDCLDYERDKAIGADGRVESRWLYTGGDAKSGGYHNSTGFFETKWGVLLDSQPDYVINVAEEYNLTGNRKWLIGEKSACEKALNFLTRREVGHTGLVAMMNDSVKQKKSSDWIDVVWAAYENAFVNAGLYEALQLWAGDEDALGDSTNAATYRAFAARLKTTFNKPIADGGFWDPTNQWYIYWRDKDGSIHGNNLVTPVNFAAIAYGICDDPIRQKAILDRMEREMQKERLFSWPLCFFSFQPEEGGGSPHTFPSYENGDIFLSWNELAIRAYADYDPGVALKYVKNILARYDEDGLSYQRYLRRSQQGAGGDILAGNCMAIVGLYRDIYGIQPQPDRLYLDPHLPAQLNDTDLRYSLRGSSYDIDLNTDTCAVAVGAFKLRSAAPYGVNATADKIEYFPGNNAVAAMTVSRSGHRAIQLQIGRWPGDFDSPREWTETSTQAKGKTFHELAGLRPRAVYELRINGHTKTALRADKTGHITFTYRDGYAVPVRFEMAPAKPFYE